MRRALPLLSVALLSAPADAIRRLFMPRSVLASVALSSAVVLLLLLSAGCCPSAPAPTPRRPDHVGKLPTEMSYSGERWTWQCERNGVSRTVRGEAVWVGSWRWVDADCIEVTESPVGSSWELTYRVKRQDGVWVAPAR